MEMEVDSTSESWRQSLDLTSFTVYILRQVKLFEPQFPSLAMLVKP